MIHKQVGSLMISTGQEEAGFPWRTQIFDMARCVYVLYTIHSETASSRAEAIAMHDAYVNQYTESLYAQMERTA